MVQTCKCFSKYIKIILYNICKKYYLDRKRPRRSSFDNESPATVDETDSRSQSITLPFVGTQKSDNKCVFGCERRVIRWLSREKFLGIFIQTNNVYK